MRFPSVPAATGVVLGVTAAVLLGGASPAGAAQPGVGLGTAASFAVLAHTTVTNTGPSVVTGNVGVSSGTAITGFTGPPKGTILGGVRHANDAVAAQAQLDLTTAYNDAAGRTPITSVGAELAGRTLAPGIYSGPTLGLTGTVTLDAENNPAAVFVFKAASTLITHSSSVVALLNGANPCNVYWQIGSSTTLGTNSRFVGTVLALASVTATTGAVVSGRLMARTGAVTLDRNTITRPTCAATIPSPSTSPAPGSSASRAPGATGPSGPAGGVPGVPLRIAATPTPSTTPTQSTTTGTTTTSTSTTPPRTTTTGPWTSPAGQPPHLALTGSNTGELARGGMLAVILGGFILLLARRGIVTAKRGR